MRKAGALSFLAFGAGSLAFGQAAPSPAQQIADLQKQIDELKAQMAAQQASSANLEQRLDGATRNAPIEALKEPRRLNLSAPGLEGLDIKGGIHVRGDYWGNFDEGGGNNDGNSFGTEAWLAFHSHVSKNTSVGLAFHYGDVWGGNTDHGLGSTGRLTGDSPSASSDTAVTVDDAFLAVNDLYNTGVNMVAGRQKLELGAERIIGDDEWQLTRTRFDGFMFNNNLGDMGSWVFIAVRLHDGENASGTELSPLSPSSPNNNPLNNADLFGAYYTLGSKDAGTFEAYVFHLEDPNYPGGTGRTRWTTYGGRWASPDMEGFNLEAEGTTQFGEVMGNRTHDWGFDTYALHAGACYAMKGVEFFKDVHAGYDYATGGGSAEENYIQIAPSLHGWFGITDFFGWSNIQHEMVGATFDVGHGTLAANYHWNRLASSNAGFEGYNVSSSSTGGSKDLGEEIDLVWSVPCTKETDVSVGLGYFFPGHGFTDQVGSNNNMLYSYLAFTTRF